MGKLQEQMKTDLLLKGYSPNTIRLYVDCIRNFAKYFMRPPAEMGETEIRQFMLYLAQDRKVSTFVQAFMSMRSSFYIGLPCAARRSSNTSLTPKDLKLFPKSSPCRKFSASLPPPLSRGVRNANRVNVVLQADRQWNGGEDRHHPVPARSCEVVSALLVGLVATDPGDVARSEDGYAVSLFIAAPAQWFRRWRRPSWPGNQFGCRLRRRPPPCSPGNTSPAGLRV